MPYGRIEPNATPTPLLTNNADVEKRGATVNEPLGDSITMDILEDEESRNQLFNLLAQFNALRIG